MFNINEFNKLFKMGDLLALNYIEDYVPKELYNLYKLILEFNYINGMCENGLLKGSVYNVYQDNLYMFLEKVGLFYDYDNNKFYSNNTLKEEVI